MAELLWTAAEPWAFAASGAGVTARPLGPLGLATVAARKGAEAALAERVKAEWGLEPPSGPRRVEAGGIAFVGTAPGTWLAVSETGPDGWAEAVATRLAGLASVSDQSDAYAGFRLEGPRAADVLAKGVFVDLHPGVFPEGSAAATVLAHMSVVVWRRGPEAFDLLGFRSYATSLRRWLEESAAEFGLGTA